MGCYIDMSSICMYRVYAHKNWQTDTGRYHEKG